MPNAETQLPIIEKTIVRCRIRFGATSRFLSFLGETSRDPIPSLNSYIQSTVGFWNSFLFNRTWLSLIRKIFSAESLEPRGRQPMAAVSLHLSLFLSLPGGLVIVIFFMSHGTPPLHYVRRKTFQEWTKGWVIKILGKKGKAAVVCGRVDSYPKRLVRERFWNGKKSDGLRVAAHKNGKFCRPARPADLKIQRIKYPKWRQNSNIGKSSFLLKTEKLFLQSFPHITRR